MVAQKTCRQCGKAFQGGPRAGYCPECRIDRRRKRDNEYKRRGSARKLGSVDTCIVCGNQYTVNSGRQMYCPECKTEAVKAIDRKQGLEYYAANKGKINPARNTRRAKPKQIQCVRCGKTIAHYGTRKKYCDACLPIIKKIWKHEAEQRRSPRNRTTRKSIPAY